MFKENILLKKYTTFQIGGAARYFCEAKGVDDIKRAVEWAKSQGLPFFILAGGSNLLVADKGFAGLVIKVQSSKLKVQSLGDETLLHCEAGVKLSDLVKLSLDEGLSGLEWAAGIPRATVGGAVWGNADAFGKNIADVVSEVEVLQVANGQLQIFKQKDCGFAYKDSVFKRNKDLIILAADLVCDKKDKEEVQEGIKKILQYRKDHHPSEPSAGSVFKNIKNEKIIFSRSELAIFKSKGEIPAGWLIEQAGLRGKAIGMAEISAKHANFIINTGTAKASDVQQLIQLVKQAVKDKFAINLEEEIQYLGF